LALWLVACGASCRDGFEDLRQPLVARDANPIVVGALGDLGGVDGPRRAALELELERLNALGGAKGRPVRLLCYDDQGRPEGLARGLERLLREDKVVALCVLSNASRTEAAQREGSRAPILAWAPAPASDAPHARSLGDVDAARCAAELVAWLSRARTYDKQDLVDAIDGPPPLPDYGIKPPPPKTAPNADPTTPKAQ
jgi:ABC-type branched-subunit amino acid transport system substrate-binding protein